MMSASANMIAVVAVMLGLSTAIARADSPPKLDVEPSCNSAAPYAIAVGRTKEACLDDERAAESTLAENWSKYNAVDKSQCVGTVNMGGPPSYVELLSCIEVLRDACGPELAWIVATWANGRPCPNRAQTDAVKKDGTVKQAGARVRRASRDPALGASASCRGRWCERSHRVIQSRRRARMHIRSSFGRLRSHFAGYPAPRRRYRKSFGISESSAAHQAHELS